MKFYGLICLFFIVVLANQVDVSTAVSPVEIASIKEKGNKQQFELVVMIELNEALSLIELEEAAAKLARNKVLQHIGQEVTHKTTIINDQLVKDAITGYRHVISKIDRTHRSISEQVIRYEFSVFIDKERMGKEYDLSLKDRIDVVNVNNQLKERIENLEALNNKLINGSDVVHRLESPEDDKRINHEYTSHYTPKIVELFRVDFSVSSSKNRGKDYLIFKGPDLIKLIELINKMYSEEEALSKGIEHNLVSWNHYSPDKYEETYKTEYKINKSHRYNGVGYRRVSGSGRGLKKYVYSSLLDREDILYDSWSGNSYIVPRTVLNSPKKPYGVLNNRDTIYLRVCDKSKNHSMIIGCDLSAVGDIYTGYHHKLLKVIISKNLLTIGFKVPIDLKKDENIISVGLVSCPGAKNGIDEINESECKLEFSRTVQVGSLSSTI